MPAVSVVTCTYNRAHLIGETIQSVLNQTFQDFEYIIIDDGSQDQTQQVVDSFRDVRLLYFNAGPTRGHLSKLRNLGISKSTGRYIAFVDSDDLWEKDKLALQVEGLEKDPSIGFSFSDVTIFNSEGILKDKLYPQTGTASAYIFDDFVQNKFVICMTTLFFRKACLDKTGPSNESFHSGDHNLIMRLAYHFKCFILYDVKVRVRRHDQNTTKTIRLHSLEEHLTTIHDLFRGRAIDLRTRQHILKKLYYSFGLQLLRGGKIREARQFFLRGLRINPFQIKSWIRVFLTLPPRLLVPR